MLTASLNSENISVSVWRKIFCSSKRTFSPKQTQNAPKNSCTSDFFPKGIQRSEVRTSTHQTILVYLPIFANENQRSTVRMSSHLVFITLTTSVQWLFTIIPTGELWKNKVHQKKYYHYRYEVP